MTLYQGEAAAARDALTDAVREGIASGRRVGVIASAGDLPALTALPVVVAEVGPDDNADAMAARLYGALRELDAAEVDFIVAREPPRDDGLWRALRDRLRRAATRLVAAS